MGDEWQSITQTKSKTRALKRRVFIGSLRFSTKLQDKIRDLFSESAISIQGDVQIGFPKHLQQKHVGSSSSTTGSACFALVECDVEMAIKCLNGRMFDGNYLAVKPEKKQFNVRKNVQKFGGGWTKPQKILSSPAQKQPMLSKNEEKCNLANKLPIAPSAINPLEQCNSETLSQEINDLVSDHLKETSKSDGLNTTIASTTAAIALIPGKHLLEKNPIEAKEMTLSSNSTEGPKSEKVDEISAFHSMCKSSILNLMNDYGNYDANFDKKMIETKEDSHLLSSVTTKKQGEIKGSKSKQISDLNGMLVPNGKAPIHIQLVSFGYKYSVPPQARGGWSHSNPLSPMDCRDLPRAPHYVAKLSGLSFKVKQALLRQCDNNSSTDSDHNHNNEENTKNDIVTVGKKENRGKKSNQLRLKGEDIGLKVLRAIEEAIHDGGHGYAFPLEVTVYIGSEYGRHRSVVLCEIVAQTIRGMLRKITDNTITCPVSVSTKHRDVDNNHRDDEAFGKDLKREHEAETRRKKKQEWLEERY